MRKYMRKGMEKKKKDNEKDRICKREREIKRLLVKKE
jgi:hypothetical protein